jgi:hypothetical protein
MTGPLPAAITAALAVVVIGGAVAAVGAREHRVALLGLLVSLCGSPFLADPIPDARGVAARIAGAALAAYLLVMATRDDAQAPGAAPISWPVALLIGTTAAIAAAAAVSGSSLPGGGSSGAGLPEPVGAPLAAPPLFVPAAAAGAALLVLGATPMTMTSEPLRLATGLVLATAGTALALAAVSGPGSPLTDLCLAVLLAAIAWAGGLLHRLSHPPRSQPARR